MRPDKELTGVQAENSTCHVRGKCVQFLFARVDCLGVQGVFAPFALSFFSRIAGVAAAVCVVAATSRMPVSMSQAVFPVPFSPFLSDSQVSETSPCAR